ncbi:MAG: heparan-alpha-glucosaminide N-acetyltransferase [Devosia sp.]
MTDNPPTARPRFAVLDVTRGLAIIAMVVYHFCWDLSYFRFIAANVGFDFGWVVFGRLVLTAFLMLVGIGLVLAHGRGIRWPAFWRRQAMVAGAAIVITVATYVAFPDSFVYFGVLHAIAVTSLLALPFLRAPLAMTVAVAAIAILLPAVHSDPFFDAPWTSWIGFWVKAPPTNDLVSVFPWFGIVLLGVIGARLVLGSGAADRLAAIQPDNRLARVLSRMGRWSLIIYLVHQPILLGVLFPLAGALQPQIAMRETDFLASCQTTCTAGGTSAGLCVTYCQCGLKGVIDNDLWNAVQTGMVTAAEQSKLDETTRQCSAVIYPVAPAAQ